MIWVLLLPAALAQGVEVVQPGECIRPLELSYLLPEGHYDACLEKAQRLDIAVDRIAELEEGAGLTLGIIDAGLEACDADRETLELALQAGEQHKGALELRVDTLRRQRNVAWLVVGGIVLGAGVAVTVAL